MTDISPSPAGKSVADERGSAPASHHGKQLEPISTDLKGDPAAANLIRQKLEAIYDEGPSAAQELAEAEASPKPLSKHQKFIENLRSSGKPVAEIQTEWHNYYLALPDEEKLAVWEEFYAAANTSHYNQYVKKHKPVASNSQEPTSPATTAPTVIATQQTAPQPPDESKTADPPTPSRASIADVRQQLLSKVASANRRQSKGKVKLSAKHHIQSLGFGLGLGVLVIIIFLFSFFNQVVITPFIQPSQKVSNLPLITDASAITASTTPQVIIPKINVDIPVDYTQTTDNENAIENALENGVVHYPSTVMPGQNGNAAFFGHSSNNIFNPGKYKFAFVLLHTLQKGDTFSLIYAGKEYTYQVIDTKIVPPTDVGVLNDTEGKQATATLITCDPPGTSINRLVVTGVQIDPAPAGNSAAPAATVATAAPTQIASNGPSLWSRFVHWAF